MGTHTTTSGTRIPIPLTIMEERQQLRETLQQSTIKRRVYDVPFLEAVGPLGMELQKKALEGAARSKVAMEVVEARGEGTSPQGRVPHSRETIVTIGMTIMRTEVWPSQTPSQNLPRGYSKLQRRLNKERRSRWPTLVLNRDR